MSPVEEATAALNSGLSCIVVPMSNGDLAILDSSGNFIFTANPDPLIHGGIGMGGLLNAFEIAFNRNRSRSTSSDAPYYRIPVRSARPVGEYYQTHPRPSHAAPLPPKTVVRAAAVPTKTVNSAAQLGFVKKSSARS